MIGWLHLKEDAVGVVVAQVRIERARRGAPRPSVPSLAVAGVTAVVAWSGVLTLRHAHALWAALAAGRAELVGPLVLVLVAAVLVCERLWPADSRPLLGRGHLHDAGFFLLHVSMVVPMMTLMGAGFAHLLGSRASWAEGSLTASWPRWLVVVATIVAMDAANWGAHWADHRVGALWRFHALHHSQEKLSVLTSFRAHPLMHTLGFFLSTIPVLVLAGLRPIAPVLITAYVCFGTLAHANVGWTFGPLGRILVSPAYHRVHHALDAPAGANLGVVLTVWDELARRAVHPDRTMRGAPTGLRGRPVPVEQDPDARRHVALVARQLVEPFGPPPAAR